MIRKRLQETIEDLQKLRRDTDRAIQELQKVIDGLSNDFDIPKQQPQKQAQLTLSNGNGEKTYAQIATDLLREAQKPLHLNEIMRGIEEYKKLPKGSVARPSLHTALMRHGKRTGLIEKAGPGKFRYVMQ